MKNYFLLIFVAICLSGFSQQATITDLQAQIEDEISFEDLNDSSTKSASAGTIVNSRLARRLLKDASLSFEKMWFADASRKYEDAFSRIGNLPSIQDLQKAADSYYYIGDMVNAAKWYQQLYDNYAEVISKDDLFKFSDALKGIDKKEKADKIVEMFSQHTSGEENTVPSFLKYDERILFKNLNINTPYSEFGSTITVEGKMVFASSADTGTIRTNRYKWNNQPFLDLYQAKTNNESYELSEVKKFSKVINTKHHEASATFTPDGNTMYFTRNNDKRKKKNKGVVNHLKIFKSDFIANKWGDAKEVSFNSENYSTGHPAITPDGKQMYFVSDMPGGYGNTDIYVVDINIDGSFSEPRNLGPEVNSKRKEMFPFTTGERLYFSSDRKSGLGGLDIYESKIENNNVSTPVNLGKPFNSIRDDFSFVTKEMGESGYLASNRKGGKGSDDIYFFDKRSVKGYVENKNSIEGLVLDSLSELPLTSASITLFNNDNLKIAEIETSQEGKFNIENLSSNFEYSIKVEKDGFLNHVQSVTTKENQKVYITSKLNRVSAIDVVTNNKSETMFKTEAVYFNFDSFTIREDAKDELDRLANYLVQHQDMKLKIESHTDSRGNAAYNKYLSSKRADASKDYLISKGVSAEQIVSATGYGEEQLLNDCYDGASCSRQAHQLNRRSEFILVRE